MQVSLSAPFMEEPNLVDLLMSPRGREVITIGNGLLLTTALMFDGTHKAMEHTNANSW